MPADGHKRISIWPTLCSTRAWSSTCAWDDGTTAASLRDRFGNSRWQPFQKKRGGQPRVITTTSGAHESRWLHAILPATIASPTPTRGVDAGDAGSRQSPSVSRLLLDASAVLCMYIVHMYITIRTWAVQCVASPSMKHATPYARRKHGGGAVIVWTMKPRADTPWVVDGGKSRQRMKTIVARC